MPDELPHTTDPFLTALVNLLLGYFPNYTDWNDTDASRRLVRDIANPDVSVPFMAMLTGAYFAWTESDTLRFTWEACLEDYARSVIRSWAHIYHGSRMPTLEAALAHLLEPPPALERSLGGLH